MHASRHCSHNHVAQTWTRYTTASAKDHHCHSDDNSVNSAWRATKCHGGFASYAPPRRSSTAARCIQEQSRFGVIATLQTLARTIPHQARDHHARCKREITAFDLHASLHCSHTHAAETWTPRQINASASDPHCDSDNGCVSSA